MTKKTVNAKIIANTKIAEDHYIINAETNYLAQNSFPGQFVLVKVQEDTSDPLLRIPLGVHVIHKKGIRLLYKVVGRATDILSSKKKNDKIDILGPLGNGFDLTQLLEEKNSKAIICAGGHGVAPLYALAERIAQKKKRIDFFIGARTKKHIVCAKELRKLGVKIHIATEDGTRGKKGYVTSLLKEFLGQKRQNCQKRIMYACGPKPMLSVIAKEAEKFQIPAQVSVDEYMACGIGACLGCAIKTKTGYKLVCKDGPVFDAQEIDWRKV